MRICVLSVMSEIVISVLRSDDENNLSEENKKLRDSFMEHLLDHVADINVFVRSKVSVKGFLSLNCKLRAPVLSANERSRFQVLKLWHAMYEKNAVPKNYVIPLLEHVIPRLRDKSSIVVKYAIQLMCLMLERNLFGPMVRIPFPNETCWFSVF